MLKDELVRELKECEFKRIIIEKKIREYFEEEQQFCPGSQVILS